MNNMDQEIKKVYFEDEDGSVIEITFYTTKIIYHQPRGDGDMHYIDTYNNDTVLRRYFLKRGDVIEF